MSASVCSPARASRANDDMNERTRVGFTLMSVSNRFSGESHSYTLRKHQTKTQRISNTRHRISRVCLKKNTATTQK